MVDNLVMDRYVEESSLKMNGKSKQHIRTLLTKFFGMKPDVAYNDLTRQDLIEMLSAFNATSIITFNSEKSKMNDFMKWMVEEGYGTDKPLKILGDITFFDLDRSHLYDKYYFRDYEELHNTMDEAFSERGSEFDTFRSAAVLVWFGIEIKYLSNILKKDIYEDEGYVVHPETKEKITLPPLAMYVLINYRDSDTYDSSKFGGSVMTYAKSKFLFRSYKNAQFTTAQIRNISSSANRAAEEIGKTFQWNKIYLNGIYNRMYQYEQEHGDLSRSDFDKLKGFFGKPDLKPTSQHKMDMARKFEEYQEFKEHMYS